MYTKYSKIWYIQNIPKYTKICQNITKNQNIPKNIPKMNLTGCYYSHAFNRNRKKIWSLKNNGN